ncbi:MAG: hypothetical protein LWX02_07440 [Deltaproteobacteria bacterium]|nr:hypothetical protein [Deltaproteobacteria bacterium]MDL1987677.1 hypothetical protein [Deltaproteobacteria bacterium]
MVRKEKTKSANVYWMMIICLGCFLLSFDTSALKAAGESIYKDDTAHFSIAIPAGFQEISQGWLPAGVLDPKRCKLCKDALKEYNKIFICLDELGLDVLSPDVLSQRTKSLVLLGIKTYKHKKKRFKVFTDYLTIDEFFDAKVTKKFGELIKKKLGEKGAEDVIVGEPVYDKENNGFGFICTYRLSEGDKAKEFHRVFLGGTHLLYLDLNLYAIDNTAPHESLFQQMVASLSFEDGFGPRDSYIDAFRKRVGSYELFGRRLSDLGRSLVHIILIVFLLNLALECVTNPKKGRYVQIEFLQRNKSKARLATIVIGILIYLLYS